MADPTKAARMRTFNTPKYDVLAYRQLSDADQQFAMATASLLVNGMEAQALAVQEGPWTYAHLDQWGNAGVLKYKGIDVSVFYKRQVAKNVEVQPYDPVPLGIISDPDDIWMRLDLMDISARQVNKRHRVRAEVEAEDYTLIRTELELKTERLETVEDELRKLKGKMGGVRILEAALQDLRLRLQAAEQNAGREVRDAQASVDASKVLLDRFLMDVIPVHEAMEKNRGDSQLHDMLVVLLEKAFKNMGVELIRPNKGAIFNPVIHHAVAVDDTAPKGVIVKVSSYGVRISTGRLIRAAQVSVGGKDEESESTPGT